MCIYSVTQSCPTLCDPVDCSLPSSSVHGISQAIKLEWGVISSSRGSSQPRDRTHVSSPALQADSLPLSRQGSPSKTRQEDKARHREPWFCRPTGRPMLLVVLSTNLHHRPPNHTPERKGAEGVAEGRGAERGEVRVELLSEPIGGVAVHLHQCKSATSHPAP